MGLFDHKGYTIYPIWERIGYICSAVAVGMSQILVRQTIKILKYSFGRYGSLLLLASGPPLVVLCSLSQFEAFWERNFLIQTNSFGRYGSLLLLASKPLLVALCSLLWLEAFQEANFRFGQTDFKCFNFFRICQYFIFLLIPVS